MKKSELRQLIREELKMITETNDSVMYQGKQISKSKAKSELKSIQSTIKSIEDKIKKQGRVTNARDEDHLKNLYKLRDYLASVSK